MKKSEMIRSIQQEMTLEQMGDDIAIIAKDVSQLKLDVVTVQNDITELRQMIREWKERRNKDNETDSRQD